MANRVTDTLPWALCSSVCLSRDINTNSETYADRQRVIQAHIDTYRPTDGQSEAWPACSVYSLLRAIDAASDRAHASHSIDRPTIYTTFNSH